MQKFSIIICTYNRDKYIYECLQCLAANNFSPELYEIILVDNNSSDNTANECKRFEAAFPNLQFRYFLETNQGLSHARNRGINEAQGDILVFLDDDAMVSSDYLMQLQKYITEYTNMSAFGGKITPLFETGVTPKWLSKWTYSLVSAINMGEAVREFKGSKYPIGANMGFCRNTLDKISFNTALGRTGKNLMAGEEKDIFNRIKAAGGKIYYFPNIAVLHVIPESRTTATFVKRMGEGIGRSEKLRSLNVSKFVYLKRLLAEGMKWVASVVLFLGYLLTGRLSKGSILLAFRYQVTKGLLSRN